MDKEILELLKTMQEGVTRIENKLDAVVEQTADLTEFRTTTTESLSKITTEIEAVRADINKVEVVTGKNCYEIEYLKAVK